MSRREKRLAAWEKAGAAEPDDLLGRALRHLNAGYLGQADTLFRELLAREPRHVAALNGLGLAVNLAGNPAVAATLFRRAIAERPDEPEFHNNLGIVLIRLGDGVGARDAFERAVALDPGHVAAITNLGTLHEVERRLDQAVAAYKRALEINPTAQMARSNLTNIYRASVPNWHFTMMNDDARNRVYDEAIRRLAPGRGVLDIGTGAGLLAMMAARAKAAWVTSCEVNRPMAAIAREVVAENGLAERINLVVKHSTSLAIGVDLPRRADLLVCEIFGSSLINEDMLPTLEHAHAHLLQPDAVVVPRRASMVGCLVGGAALEAYFFVDQAVGFSLARFNEFAPLKLGIRVGSIPHQALSADFEIFGFDLGQAKFESEQRSIDIVATKPGRCPGIAQWTRLDVADDLVYENRPDAGAAIDSWGQMVHRFESAIELKPGDRLQLLARHDRANLAVSRVVADSKA